MRSEPPASMVALVQAGLLDPLEQTERSDRLGGLVCQDRTVVQALPARSASWEQPAILVPLEAEAVPGLPACLELPAVLEWWDSQGARALREVPEVQVLLDKVESQAVLVEPVLKVLLAESDTLACRELEVQVVVQVPLVYLAYLGHLELLALAVSHYRLMSVFFLSWFFRCFVLFLVVIMFCYGCRCLVLGAVNRLALK